MYMYSTISPRFVVVDWIGLEDGELGFGLGLGLGFGFRGSMIDI